MDGHVVERILCLMDPVSLQTGLEYQNTIVIQVHRSLVTQSDKIYNVRCKYESMNTDHHSQSEYEVRRWAWPLPAGIVFVNVMYSYWCATNRDPFPPPPPRICDQFAVIRCRPCSSRPPLSSHRFPWLFTKAVLSRGSWPISSPSAIQ